jgi:hypothetical protein
MDSFRTYPNLVGHRPSDSDRGALRTGIVEENQDTKRIGIAGELAAVTHEQAGEVRFYVFILPDDESDRPGVSRWMGPYMGLSEEILSDEPTYHPVGMSEEEGE